MPTTFSPTFKNAVVNTLTGRASVPSGNFLGFVNCYSGTQTADPTTAPTGSFVNSSVGNAPSLSTKMTQPSGGISQLSSPSAASANANNAITVTTARILGSDAATANIDTTASLAGGGGGVIVPTLTSSTGTPFVIDFLSIKLPSSNGTISINDALRDALISAVCVTQTNTNALSSASVKVYSGSAPASANAPATGTVLWTGTTAASGASWNTASAGSAALVSNISAAASASGTGGYVRIEKGTYVLQGSIGTSGTDFVFDSITMTSGQTYQLTNATITL